MPRASWTYVGATCAGLFIAGVGCGPSQKTVSKEEENLAQLSRLYGLYVSKHKGRPPANLEALKEFAQKTDKSELKARGVTATDPTSIFVSSRDKQPFVYRPPARTGAPGAGPEGVIFYEQTGADGKRFVAYTTPGKVGEVDDAKFKELVPDAR